MTVGHFFKWNSFASCHFFRCLWCIFDAVFALLIETQSDWGYSLASFLDKSCNDSNYVTLGPSWPPALQTLKSPLNVQRNQFLSVIISSMLCNKSISAFFCKCALGRMSQQWTPLIQIVLVSAAFIVHWVIGPLLWVGFDSRGFSEKLLRNELERAEDDVCAEL